MPEYTIRDADTGQQLRVRGDKPPSPRDMEELFAAHYATTQPQAGQIPAGAQSTIGEELARGVGQVVSSTRTGLGALFGDEEAAVLSGLERGEEQARAYGEAPSFERVKRVAEEEGIPAAAAAGVGQVPRALAGQAGVIGTAIGGARLGAAIAPPVPILKGIGALIGAGAALYPQFVGSNVQRQAQEQIAQGTPESDIDVDVGGAARAAIAQSLVESAGTGFVLGKRMVKGILGIADEAPMGAKAAEELRKVAERTIKGSIARGAARGAGAEIPVEVAQQVIERDQAGLDLLSDDALAEYGEAAYMAATVGGVLGGGTNIFAPSAARAQIRAEEEALDTGELDLEQAEATQSAAAVSEEDLADIGATEEEIAAAPEEVVTPEVAVAPEEAVTPEEVVPVSLTEEETQELTAEEDAIVAAEQARVAEEEAVKGRTAAAERDAEAAKVKAELDAAAVDAPEATKEQLQEEFGGREEFDAEGRKALDTLEGVENLPEKVRARLEINSARLDPQAEATLAKRVEDGFIERFKTKDTKNEAALKRNTAKNEKLPFNAVLYYLDRGFSPKVGVRMVAYDLATLDPAQDKKAYARAEAAEKYIRTLPNGGTVLDTQVAEIKEDVAQRAKASETVVRLKEKYGEQWKEQAKKAEERITRKELNTQKKLLKDEALADDPVVDRVETLQAYLQLQKEEELTEDKSGADLESAPKMTSEQVAADVEAFLKSGGVITQALRLDAVAASSISIDTAALEQLKQGNIGGALEAIFKSSVNANVRKTVSKLRANMGQTRVELVADLATPDGIPLAGLFNPRTNTIQINSSVPIAIHTVIHEASHASTSHILANPSHPLTRKLTSIYNEAKDTLGSAYGSTSLDEFVVEYNSNPDFANELASYTPEGSKKSLWRRIVDAFAEFFGLDMLKSPNAQQRLEEYVGAILSPAPAYRDAGVMYSMLNEGKDAELAGLLIGGGKGLASSGVTEASLAHTRGIWESLTEKTRQFALNSIALNNIADLVKDTLPSVATFHNVLREQAGARNKLLDAHKRTVDTLYKTFKGDKEARNALNELVMNSTLRGVDPLKPKTYKKYDAEQLAAWDAMQPLVKKLRKKPAQLKAYTTMRDSYAAMDKRILEALDKRLTALIGDEAVRNTIKNKIVLDIVSKNKIDPYFPLYRDGEFWIQYTLDGEPYVASFDTRGQRNAAIAQLERNPQASNVQRKNRDEVRESIRALPTSAVFELYNKVLPAVKDTEVATKIQDILFEVLPEQALLQGYRHRKGTLGFEEDAILVYQKRIPSLISNLTNVEYDIKLEEQARAIREEAAAQPNNALVQDVLRATVGRTTMRQRRAGDLPSYLEFSRNPYIAQWARNLKSAAFFGTLGLNVSSVVVNATNIPVVGMPWLAARYGGIKSTAAIMSALKTYMGTGFKREAELFPTVDENGNPVSEEVTVRSGFSLTNDPTKNPLYGPLSEMFIKYGLDSRTLAGDMFDLENPSNSLLNKTQAASGFLFNHAERMNRQVFAMAVYKLEMEKITKKKFDNITEAELEAHGEAAAQKAIDGTEEINSSALLTSAPRFSQGDIGSLVFMYKRYPSAILSMQAKMFKSLLNDMTRKRQRALAAGEITQEQFDAQTEEARILRNQLAYQYASAGALAGVAGVPLYGVVSLAFNTFLMDDDEEDFDTIISKAIGEGPMSGLLNNYFNVSISDRISQTNLMVRTRANYEPDSLVEHMLETYGGPIAGLGMRFIDGVGSLAEGGEAAQRGAERLLPSFIANPMKAYRYATKGAVSMRGDPILEGTMAPHSLFAQALGFAPASYTKQLEINALNKRIDRNVAERRTNILRKYYKSLRDGDTESMQETVQELNEFNTRHPEVAITAETIKRSLAQHARTSAQTRQLGGITINRRRMAEVMRSNEEFGDDWM